MQMDWFGSKFGSGNPKSETRRLDASGAYSPITARSHPRLRTNQIRNQNDEWATHSGFGHSGLILVSGFGLLVLFAVARAQNVSVAPFYYASGTAYDAQDKTLIVGANQSLGQAVVSGDRKHVTLDLDTGLLGSAGVQGFTYQRAGRGFVGSASAAPAASPGGGGLMPTIKTSPSDIEPDLSVLDKPGMVLIAPLER
jgi:hypothetical protein